MTVNCFPHNLIPLDENIQDWRGRTTLRVFEEWGNSGCSLIREEMDRATMSPKDIPVILNPSGSFVVGGPEADTGLTGRKLMVDAYGPFVSQGGGALSGKDPTKIDRTAGPPPVMTM